MGRIEEALRNLPKLAMTDQHNDSLLEADPVSDCVCDCVFRYQSMLDLTNNNQSFRNSNVPANQAFGKFARDA
jgi:hypothetical protein